MAASLTNPLATGAQGAPVNILLVDDQPGRLLTYRAILEPLGERLVEASSGEQALARLMEEDFAVILLDVNMPGMDGFETASLIHQHPRFEKTPIIFVTAVNVGDMDRLRGYKLGAVDYVSVPVIPEILRSKVAVLAELHRKRLELQEANAALASANIALQAEKQRELERLNASLREANDALESRNAELNIEVAERARAEGRLRDADRRKDEFLATLAHELRNPLAPLQNALAIQRLGGHAEAPLQAMMERQLGLLVRLIDDLLDIARISRGKLTLRPAPTTLREVLESAMETARPLVEGGGHALQLKMPDADIPMHADRERLAQVFANLLNNAAKYSDADTPIDVIVHLDDTGIDVGIHDQGVGLSEDEISRIFDLFSQAGTGEDRSRGGLGIGLTIVQQLVQMHGGNVRAQSQGHGHGSAFHVFLPHATTPMDDDASVTPPPPATATPSLRALVVDDNRDAADSLAMMLGLLGHEARSLHDPLEVAGVVRDFHPHVLFLDIGMPALDGHALARQLRTMPGGDAMCLVAVTGWGQPDDLRRSRKAGFDHHLVKPPQMQDIIGICVEAATHCTGNRT